MTNKEPYINNTRERNICVLNLDNACVLNNYLPKTGLKSTSAGEKIGKEQYLKTTTKKNNNVKTVLYTVVHVVNVKKNT